MKGLSPLKKLLVILFLVFNFQVQALHIVGGELSYEHLGGDLYELTLLVYRDCASQGGPYDSPALISIYSGDGVFQGTISIGNPQISLISTEVDFDCVNVSASVCVQRGYYQGTTTLSANDSGYHLVYQRCCRNSSIVNIANPDNWGSTYTTFVPSVNALGFNSSPFFNSLPPVGLCANIPIVYDNSATDLDGDSIVYKFCAPYHGGSQGDPIPNPASGPPFVGIQWNPGYSVDYQIDASPAFAIDPVTGVLTGTPTQQGQYVIGICAEEYRDGVLINEIRRDFQFNVLICPDLVQSGFADLNNGLFCQGLGVQFDNQSINASNYYWDFGDGTSSNNENPFHVYAEGGKYEVMLISDPLTACPDTIISIYNIWQTPQPEIEDIGVNCPEGSYDFGISGDLFDPETYSWMIPSDASSNGLITANLDQVFFAGEGVYDIFLEVVNEGGCTGQDEYQIEVPLTPIADIQVTDNPCVGLAIDFSNGSVNAETFQWTFGDTGFNSTSTAISPAHTYPSAGFYTVTLTALNPGACPNTDSQEIQVNPVLFMELGPISPQCTEGNEFDFSVSGNTSSSSIYTWSILDTAGLEVSNSPSNVQFSQAGSYLVTVQVDDGPCTFTDEGFAIVVDPVQADFSSQDGGCAPETAYFQDLTTGGMGLEYHWDFGDGDTGDFPGSLSHEYEQAGFFDVRLEVEATAGCPSIDVMIKENYIEVLPRPTAAFSAEPPYADINNPFVQFTSTSIGADDCLFIIQGAGNFEGCEVGQIFPLGGSYEVTLVATNDFGCVDQIARPYIVRGHAFYAPNAVTLNQDGVNDFFKAVVTGELAEYELTIFDRYGQILFQTDSPDIPWVPEYSQLGVHAFTARIRDAYNFPVIYEGSFTVIR